PADITRPGQDRLSLRRRSIDKENAISAGPFHFLECLRVTAARAGDRLHRAVRHVPAKLPGHLDRGVAEDLGSVGLLWCELVWCEDQRHDAIEVTGLVIPAHTAGKRRV